MEKPVVSASSRPRLLVSALICFALVTACSPAAAPPPEATQPAAPPAYVWALDNAESSNEGSMGDVLTLMDAHGSRILTLGGYGADETIGGYSGLAVSPAGDFVIVAELLADRLSRVGLDGQVAWVVETPMRGAAVSSSGLVFAVRSGGHVSSGNSLAMLDAATGAILNEVSYHGVDLVLDDARQAVWLIGPEIRRLGFDLAQQFEVDPIGWTAVAADLLLDGSIVVAERSHGDLAEGGANRILRVSPTGEVTVLAELDYMPYDLAVNPLDGSYWVTELYQFLNGQIQASVEGLHHYAAHGEELGAIDLGGRGTFVSVDPLDGSVWVGSWPDGGGSADGEVFHLASDGAVLGRFPDFTGYTVLAVARPQTAVPTQPAGTPMPPEELSVYRSGPQARGDVTDWQPISGEWVVWSNGNYRQADASVMGAKSMLVGWEPASRECYTIRVRGLTALEGQEGVMVIFPFQGHYAWWNIGGWTNTASMVEGILRAEETRTDDRLVYDTTYDAQITVRGAEAIGFLDGRAVWRITRTPQEVTGLPEDGLRGSGLEGFAGVGSWLTSVEFRELEAMDACGILAPGGIPLNEASPTEIWSLPMYGPELTEWLMAFRAEGGRLNSVEDLLAVPRLGAGQLERLASFIRVGG